MIIVLRKGVTDKEINHLKTSVGKLGLKCMISKGIERTIVGVIGPEDVLRVTPLEVYPGVEKVMPVLAPYKLVSREFKKEDTVIKIGQKVKIGGKKIEIMAGPCSIENKKMLEMIAKTLSRYGVSIIRGGAFKPRTSPYAFQGLGEKGLKMMKEVAEKYKLITVTEVMDTRDVDLVAKYADILQVGARNMQNFNLLKEVGMVKKPVFLKRGMSSTIKDLLMSAEYILAGGNFDVMLCERGIRTFSDVTRNTLDISAIPAIKQKSHLPVIADPSHATGKWGLIPATSKAAIAAGADGLMIEVHPNPEKAYSDGEQSMLPKKFAALIPELRAVAKAVKREL